MSATEIPVLTVTELTRQVKDLVEANFSTVYVQGEISNFTRAGSGHLYFTLKDESSQLRAVMWRGNASRLKFELQDGLEVVAVGPLEVYQARGTVQLIAQQIIPQGLGALELAFRQLQEKLSREGLFDPERKRALPRYPRRIALVTSPTSAAVRDMLQVITRRWQAANIIILPVAVQGEGAAQQIAAALSSVSRLGDVDVVITGRGGGSLEDLWAFNEEIVARAISDCPIPVISAVGHEIDVSIADLVADRRALTPSEAGELVVPDQAEIAALLDRIQDQFRSALRERAAQSRLRLDALGSRRIFSHPLERIHDLTARVDELENRLKRSMKLQLDRAQQEVAALSGSLDALSPLKVLSRGYSITMTNQTGEVIRAAEELKAGDQIVSLLGKGRVKSRVESVDSTASATNEPSSSSNNDAD